MRFSPAILSLCFFLLITNLLAEEADDFRAQVLPRSKIRSPGRTQSSTPRATSLKPPNFTRQPATKKNPLR